MTSIALARARGADMLRFAIAGAFIVAVMLFANWQVAGLERATLMIVAAVFGAYMAMNIGANDVANNVGPSVGSGALTMTGAIIIAAVFEAAGALIAGGSVTGTIKKGIIDPVLIGDTDTFIWLMTAALLAAALWLNLATWMGAPVSTTHSIVGGVLGAGIAAGGWAIANWPKMGQIAASWVISPVLGGIIAATFLYIIKRTIVYQPDKIAAARRVVPWLLAIMTWAFSSYLLLKGLKKVYKMDITMAVSIGLVIAVVLFFIIRPVIARMAERQENTRAGINNLFTWPLIFSAALLSFAHGANDVANAVGPLAGIHDAIVHGAISKKAGIPFWVMAVGALGIAIGLALFGPRLIRTVGSEITQLDKMRAFCVALAAAITVIIATQLGLPVSSTHIAVGGVFGVGFLREFLEANYRRSIEEILARHADDEDPEAVERFLEAFEQATLAERKAMLKKLKKEKVLKKKERKKLKKVYRRQLVRRSMLYRIAAAWVITVPFSGALAALLFFTIRGIMLP